MPWKFTRQPSPVPSCPACCPNSRSPRDNHTPNPRTELRPKSNAMTSSSRRRRKTHIHPVLNIVRNLSQHEPSLKPNPPPRRPDPTEPQGSTISPLPSLPAQSLYPTSPPLVHHHHRPRKKITSASTERERRSKTQCPLETHPVQLAPPSLARVFSLSLVRHPFPLYTAPSPN